MFKYIKNGIHYRINKLVGPNLLKCNVIKTTKFSKYRHFMGGNRFVFYHNFHTAN